MARQKLPREVNVKDAGLTDTHERNYSPRDKRLRGWRIVHSRFPPAATSRRFFPAATRSGIAAVSRDRVNGFAGAFRVIRTVRRAPRDPSGRRGLRGARSAGRHDDPIVGRSRRSFASFPAMSAGAASDAPFAPLAKIKIRGVKQTGSVNGKFETAERKRVLGGVNASIRAPLFQFALHRSFVYASVTLPSIFDLRSLFSPRDEFTSAPATHLAPLARPRYRPFDVLILQVSLQMLHAWNERPASRIPAMTNSFWPEEGGERAREANGEFHYK